MANIIKKLYFRIGNGVYKLAVLNKKTKGVWGGTSWNNALTPPTTYVISLTLTEVTGSSDNPTTIQKNGTATLHFTANAGYELPDSIPSNNVSGVKSYLWDKATGTLQLNIATSNVRVIIGGVLIPPQGETWLMNNWTQGTAYDGFEVNINFTSNSNSYTQIKEYQGELFYGNSGNYTRVYGVTGWDNQNYKTVYFPVAPAEGTALRNWLNINATPQ